MKVIRLTHCFGPLSTVKPGAVVEWNGKCFLVLTIPGGDTRSSPSDTNIIASLDDGMVMPCPATLPVRLVMGSFVEEPL